MRRGRLLPWRHSAYVGTSIPSLSRSTRGVTVATALPLGCWWHLSLGYFARSLPRRGGPSVEALRGPSSPVYQTYRVRSSTPRVSRVDPARIGAGVFSGAFRTSQFFGKHPFPPPFLLTRSPLVPASFRPSYLRADNVLSGWLDTLSLCLVRYP